jgi:small conductance mechanosensitive channel
MINEIWNNHSMMIMAVGYKLALALLFIVLAFFFSKMARKFILKCNTKYENFDATLVPVLSTVATMLVFTVFTVMLMDLFEINTTSLITLLGAAGLAVGLALKDTLSNIAAGIMLLILRPFKKDHAIECGSVAGTVKDIGLFVTQLITPDGLYVSMPNSYVWGSPLKNFTRNGIRRMDLVVGISYSDSIDTAFKVFQQIIDEDDRFLKDPAPQMMMQTMGDSSVNCMVRAWASVDDYWDVYWKANKKLKEQTEAAGLSIPFPQRDVNVYHHDNKSDSNL